MEEIRVNKTPIKGFDQFMTPVKRTILRRTEI